MKLAAPPSRQKEPFAERRFVHWSGTGVALGLLLVALIGWAFLPVLHNGFVNFDDDVYVLGNDPVRAGLTWPGVAWAFTTGFASNWHPLTWLSHMLDCQFFGVQPWGHHLTSVVLHAANAILLFAVFSRMTGALWRSFFVAAIFALHPLRVESVAWVAERKDVLSGLFWMLTLCCYAAYAGARKNQSSKSKMFYTLALFCFALGLMAKPVVVTLPFVLLLLDYWPLARSGLHSALPTPHSELAQSGAGAEAWKKLVLEKTPFFILAAAGSLVTFLVQQHGGSVVTMIHLPLGDRLENVFVAYVRYLGKMFVPADLSIIYAMPAHWPMAEVTVSILLLAAISTTVVLARRRWPFLPVGWFWFLGTLVPMIGLVQVGEQSLADRYTYLPGIGVLIMVAWGVPELMGGPRWRGALITAAAMAMVLCAAATRQQAGYWKDSETLFRHALAAKEDNFGIRIDFGNALLSQGRLDEGIEQFQAAVREKPDMPLTHSRLATALHARGRLDDAIVQLEEILKLNPNDADAENEIGAILVEQGHYDDAISRYRQADAWRPNAAATHFNWGIALCYQGKYAEAVGQLEQATALEPGNARAHYNFGIALFHTGRVDDAIREFSSALALEPNAPKTHYRLGLALAQAGRRDEAVAEFRAALALQPNYAEAARELAKLTAKQ